MADMQVKCGVCNMVLVDIQKDEITVDDQALYQQMCSCSVDGQESIQIIVSGE